MITIKYNKKSTSQCEVLLKLIKNSNYLTILEICLALAAILPEAEMLPAVS